jgi:hypothetical protein
MRMTRDSSGSPVERRRRLLLEAVLALVAGRLTVLLVPFRVYSKVLGRPMTESPQAATAAPESLRAISEAIVDAGRRVPWTNKCVEQALAAKLMLRRRGLSNTLYFGVARDVTLEAHAWLRSGDVCVTGEAELERYTIVAKFADGAAR